MRSRRKKSCSAGTRDTNPREGRVESDLAEYDSDLAGPLKYNEMWCHRKVTLLTNEKFIVLYKVRNLSR